MPSSDQRFAAACALAAALLVAAYANHFHNSFHFDDAHTVENNLFLRDLRNLPRFFTSAATVSSLPANQNWRPLVTTTLAVDYALGGLDPLWFHLTNFGWFALQCALLLAFFRALLERAGSGPDSRWLALLGAALFGLHPAMAETVNYVIARSDILSTALVCLALHARLAWPRWRRWHLYLLPAAAGLLAKEQAAVFVLLLFLQIAFFEEQLDVGALLRPAALLRVARAVLPAALACGALALLSLSMGSALRSGRPNAGYALAQPFVVVHYLITFLLPLGLSADTDWTAIANPFDDRVLVGLLVIAALLAVAVRCSRAAPTRPIAYGLSWFLVALLPTSLNTRLAEVMNDHRLYLPSVGLSLAATSAVGLWLRRPATAPALRRAAPAALAALALAAAFGVHARNRVWRSEETLWKDVTEKSPGNARGWMNYGLSHLAAGRTAAAQECFLKALQLAPGYSYARLNLAIAEAVQGRRAEAETQFREALRLAPDVPSHIFYYASWLDRWGREEEAVPLLRRTLARSPADLESRRLLLRILARLGHRAEVEALARETLSLVAGEPEAVAALAGQPTLAPSQAAVDHLAASFAHYSAGRFAEALAEAERALALEPRYAEALNNKCAACNELGRYPEAAEACGEALRLRPDFPLAANNLAVARAHGR